MFLSVIIVNYNVKYFLELCLCSVEKALLSGYLPDFSSGEGSSLTGSGRIGAEVFVVDNNSGDGSVEYLQSRFPWVEFIASRENLGFSCANNLALARARGKYILFLNPDTV